ncbi:MAG: iron-sulfur cluster assembly scaffold protein [Candidatus Peribacteraceae bacterium]|nr:iron-sulfur cluster assembly scaffold protein [Candidatus Peribacteraceae bacterium]
MDLYADNILDHYRNPRNKGPLPKANIEHTELNANCGDSLSLRLSLKGKKIEEARWQGTGCAISQAGMSLLSEELAGMSLKDAAALPPSRIYGLLGVPVGPRRTKCALLCLHALKNTIHKHEGKPPQSWTETLGQE